MVIAIREFDDPSAWLRLFAWNRRALPDGLTADQALPEETVLLLPDKK